MLCSFSVFYLTEKSCKSCWEAIDTPRSIDMTDAQRGEQCQKECQWICWPITISLDIVSCPFRGVHHVTKDLKCCKKNKIITVQPY